MHAPSLLTQGFQVGDWLVEPSLNSLACGDERVKIEPRTMDVLVYLAERSGQVVAQSELESSIWKDVVVTSQSVYQSIAQLRRVLKDDAREPRYIATVSRRGYRLIAPVKTATPARRASDKAPAAPIAETPPVASNRRRAVRAATFAAAIAVIALAGVLVWRAQRAPGDTPRASIAVLPFTDLSTAHDNAAFCDGLTDELSSALAQLSEVRVIARNSAYQFRDAEGDVRVIGSRLGVSHVLRGSVRRDASHLRVTASLVDAKSGVQVWSRTIDKRSDELLKVQEEIANDVVTALEIELSPQSAQRLRKQSTVNPNAYELYLLGRYQQLTRDPAALERAIAYQKEALTLDPSFALAYAGLADAHLGLYYYRGLRLDQSAPEIELDIRHALELDSGLAEAYAARGVLRTEQWRLPEAIADLEKAIVLKPNNGESMIRLGVAREYLGEPRDALTQYDRALTLDPLNFPLHVRRCLTLQNMARYADAMRDCQRAVELQPEHPNGYWTTGLIALAQGDLAGATAGYEKALEKAPWRADLLLQLGYIALDAGKPEDARRYFDRAVTQEHDDPAAVELDRARFFLVTGTPADLGKFLDGIDIDSFRESPELFDAALLELLAGRQQLAHTLVVRARSRVTSESAAFENVWDARWGRNARLTIALDALARGDQAEAERQLAALDGWIHKLEKNGQVWHGAKYLHASELALRGNKSEALAAFDDAVRTGWRRAWWTQVDPAMASIRQEAMIRLRQIPTR